MSYTARLMTLIGALQGALLCWLWDTGQRQLWPATEPMLFGALIWASVVVPPAYYLSENTGISSRRRTLLLTSIGVVYALLGSYAGWMSEPLHADDKYRDELVGSFNQVVAALVAGFKWPKSNYSTMPCMMH